jgi:hypothetical protein
MHQFREVLLSIGASTIRTGLGEPAAGYVSTYSRALEPGAAASAAHGGGIARRWHGLVALPLFEVGRTRHLGTISRGRWRFVTETGEPAGAMLGGVASRLLELQEFGGFWRAIGLQRSR